MDRRIQGARLGDNEDAAGEFREQRPPGLGRILFCVARNAVNSTKGWGGVCSASGGGIACSAPDKLGRITIIAAIR